MINITGVNTMYRMSGYRGDWGYRGGWGRRPHPMFFFPAILFAGFIFFGLFKFFLPLIALGLVFVGIRTLMHGGHGGWGHGEGRGREFWNQGWDWENRWGGHGRWHEKRKHDWMDEDKPKRNAGNGDDEPRYTRAPNGDWVEIV